MTDAPLTAAASAPLLVVCLCAAWCRVCDEYRDRFDQVQKNVRTNHPQTQFLWIDVEDEADLLHPLDVENFPTVLIAAGDAPRFFGTITPQAQTLERLVQSYLNDTQARVLTDPELLTVVANIRTAKLN